MIKTTIIPENNRIVIDIPDEMIGKKVDVIAYQKGEIIEDFVEDDLGEIPEWHKELVLAESKRVRENPDSLIPWDEVKSKLFPKLIN